MLQAFHLMHQIYEYCIMTLRPIFWSIMLLINFDKTVKGVAYNSDLNIWWKKFKGDSFIGHDISILLYKYSWIYKYSFL